MLTLSANGWIGGGTFLPVGAVVGWLFCRKIVVETCINSKIQFTHYVAHFGSKRKFSLDSGSGLDK